MCFWARHPNICGAFFPIFVYLTSAHPWSQLRYPSGASEPFEISFLFFPLAPRLPCKTLAFHSLVLDPPSPHLVLFVSFTTRSNVRSSIFLKLFSGRFFPSRPPTSHQYPVFCRPRGSPVFFFEVPPLPKKTRVPPNRERLVSYLLAPEFFCPLKFFLHLFRF